MLGTINFGTLFYGTRVLHTFLFLGVVMLLLTTGSSACPCQTMSGAAAPDGAKSMRQLVRGAYAHEVCSLGQSLGIAGRRLEQRHVSGITDISFGNFDNNFWLSIVIAASLSHCQHGGSCRMQMRDLL